MSRKVSKSLEKSRKVSKCLEKSRNVSKSLEKSRKVSSSLESSQVFDHFASENTEMPWFINPDLGSEPLSRCQFHIRKYQDTRIYKPNFGFINFESLPISQAKILRCQGL